MVGWDAADWNIIDPLMARGAMPNLRRLVETGVRGDLRTLEPKLSPLLWSSIATGKTADKHGILNFVEPNPVGPGVRVVSSTTRRTKALWNIVTQAGMRVHAVSWYASHPAEPINGCCVSNLSREGAPSDAAASWPLPEGAVHAEPAVRERVAAARVRPATLPAARLREVLPALDRVPRGDARVRELAEKWSQALSVHGAAREILAAERAAAREWDCMLVFHESIDTIGHHFMELRPPRMSHVDKDSVRLFGEVMDRVYIRHDELLGSLLEAAGPETSVILLSDHGFYSGEDRPVAETWRNESGAVLEARWHRPEGVIVLSGPGFKRGERIAAPTLLDIAPTALAVLGLPVGEDMDGRVITEALAKPPTPETIPSWDERPGEAGLHPADMRQDPFEAADALKQLVDLGYMPAMGEDHERLLDLARRETRWNLGTVLMTTHRQREAIPIFAELVQMAPDETRYVIPLAQCQQAAGDLAGCISTVRAFMARGREFVDARIILAHALAMSGQGAEADAEIARVVAECGSHAAMALALGDLLATRERWAEADTYLRRAEAHDPRSTAVKLARARAAMAEGRHEAAAEFCLDATEIQMVLPEAHFILGAALAWLGDLKNAVLSLQHAVTMQPGHVDAQEFLAAVARARGDLPCAAEAEACARALQERLRTIAGTTLRSIPSWGASAWEAARGSRRPG